VDGLQRQGTERGLVVLATRERNGAPAHLKRRGTLCSRRMAAPRLHGLLRTAGRQRHRAKHGARLTREHRLHAQLGFVCLARGTRTNDVPKLRLLQGGEQVVVVRLLVHHVERVHAGRKRGRHRLRQLLPPRRFLGGPRFGSGGLHSLTWRHALVRDGVLMQVRMHPHHAQRLARFVSGDGQGDMREKPLRPAAEHAQSVAVADKPKRCGGVHDSHHATPLHSRSRLLLMPIEHAGERHLPIREKPIQHFPVGHRGHLFREALSGIDRGQRHNPPQPFVQSCIAQRFAPELGEHVSQLNLAWLTHASIRSQMALERDRDG
jgi:hypothetical protein